MKPRIYWSIGRTPDRILTANAAQLDIPRTKDGVITTPSFFHALKRLDNHHKPRSATPRPATTSSTSPSQAPREAAQHTRENDVKRPYKPRNFYPIYAHTAHKNRSERHTDRERTPRSLDSIKATENRQRKPIAYNQTIKVCYSLPF